MFLTNLKSVVGKEKKLIKKREGENEILRAAEILIILFCALLTLSVVEGTFELLRSCKSHKFFYSTKLFPFLERLAIKFHSQPAQKCKSPSTRSRSEKDSNHKTLFDKNVFIFTSQLLSGGCTIETCSEELVASPNSNFNFKFFRFCKRM